MDFIKQLRGFRKQRLLNPIGANSICLYLILFEYDNDLGFLDWFTAPNSVLQGLTGLSLKSIQRSRNELMQKGYIQYQTGRGNSAGKYRLCDLTINSDQQSVHQMSNNTSIECPTDDLQSVHQVSTLNNLTKLELKLNNNPPKSPKGETDMFEGYDFSQRVQTKLSEWLRYKQERREGYKPTGLKRFLSRVENALQSYAEADVLEQMDMAMANNWQGIAYDRLKGKERPSPAPEKSREVPADILESQARQQAALEKLKSGTARLEDLL